jgi:hypothetical protein
MHYAKIQAAIAIPLLVLTVEPIYRWVELPLTRFGKRLVEGRRQPARMENAGVGELLKRAA